MPTRSRTRRRAAWIAVAAGLVVAFLAFRGGDEEGLPPATFVCEAPLGEAPSLAAFRWSFALPEGGHYELRIYDEGYTLLGAFADLTEPRLELTPDQAALLPDRIVWEVFAHDAADADVGSCRAEAERREP